MPCSKCGDGKSSIEREREREATAIKRREQAAQVKAAYNARRADLVAQVKRQREQTREG